MHEPSCSATTVTELIEWLYKRQLSMLRKVHAGMHASQVASIARVGARDGRVTRARIHSYSGLIVRHIGASQHQDTRCSHFTDQLHCGAIE
jgi:hypothetical protein